MGYLLKEALKLVCGANNHWSYAVFWKFGYQNPKLLIWEECYHGNLQNQGLTSQKMEGYDAAQLGDPVHILIDKMMAKQVNMVGEGLVGRAAFTGNHQWIVSGNYNENAHPAEVLNEVHLQFSAGMQTIAVIPVIPHGVVQLASPLAIMENVGFVHDVKSVILQVGCVPGTFMSENYGTRNSPSLYGLPVDMTSIPLELLENQMQMNSNSCASNSFNLPQNTSQILRHANHSSNSLLSQFQDNLHVSGSVFSVPNLVQESCKSLGDHNTENISSIVDRSICPPNILVDNNVNGDIEMPLKPDPLMNGERGHVLQKSIHSNIELHSGDASFKELVGMLSTGDQLCNHGNLGLPNHKINNGDYGHRAKQNHGKGLDSDSTLGDFCGSKVSSSKDMVADDTLFQSYTGDDLFDVLGVDFKNKLLNGNNSKLQNRLATDSKDQIKNLSRSMNLQNPRSEVYSDYSEGISESGIFSLSSSDHLLDAVISGVSTTSRQISDDVSCRTTLSKLSNSSLPSSQSNPLLSGLVNMSDQMQGQLFRLSKPMMTLGESMGASVRSAYGKNDSGNCSMSSSTYGSQISSWIEQGHSVSVSTANSKKPDEAGKTNRKRLKPGENPRPRPKDRQMIQDRVKELREIVPNGAKCSIDALLERTIKHMLFLQSVTKHADKLKQTVESKITNKEDGRLLKDNFEAGATWAFELGSQSMVCPIVVEDLNPPRQLLIEMLCEERGFFLEIADIIRGLGLTILKGVMEARNDKIWARFAVEANRDVTRMEVFISLVHLLEQTLNGSSGSTNDTTDKNVKSHSTSMGTNEQLVGPIVCGEPSTL